MKFSISYIILISRIAFYISQDQIQWFEESKEKCYFTHWCTYFDIEYACLCPLKTIRYNYFFFNYIYTYMIHVLIYQSRLKIKMCFKVLSYTYSTLEVERLREKTLGNRFCTLILEINGRYFKSGMSSTTIARLNFWNEFELITGGFRVGTPPPPPLWLKCLNSIEL